jgi:hypothetical protein
MTTDQVLTKARRLMNEVDQNLSLVTDEEILGAVVDARDYLEAVSVADFETLEVGTELTETDPAYGITPDPTLQQGMILAYMAAAALSGQEYLAKLKRGEIGTSWSSGLEAESTLQAGRDYKDAVDDLDAKAKALVLAYQNDDLHSRPQ